VDRTRATGRSGLDAECTGIDAPDRPNFHICRGSVGFPKYRLSLPLRIYPKGYILQPKTIGEHVRKRRMDLGMLQREVAVKIGATGSSVYNWERGTEPELIHIPKIIKFLGYVPFECPDDLLGRLRYYKLINGMSFERLGAAMGRDPEQLVDWMSNGMKPCKRNVQFIEIFLKKKLR